MSLLEVVVVYYAVVLSVTLLAYAWDKHAAQRRGVQRVRERTLHLCALAGGFAGAWIGQGWLRHKTCHPAFAVVSTLAAALHLGLWAWWWSGR